MAVFGRSVLWGLPWLSLINPEDGGTEMLRNIVNCPSVDAALRHIAEDTVS